MSSSGHLVHGMGEAWEAPVWPAITDAEAVRVTARFPDAGGCEAALWHSPRPFSSAALLACGAGRLFLKRHHIRLRSAKALAEEHRFMIHLRQRGLLVPELLTTADSQTMWTDGEWIYELHRMGQGQDLYRDRMSWTGFVHPRHGFAAGEALAHLHNAAEGYDAPARGPHALVTSSMILTAADPIAAAADYVHARPAVAAYFKRRSWWAELALIWEQLDGEDVARDCAQQPALWTHGDWHPSNLLWNRDGSAATVLDFGLADRSFALHDLAMAIERCAIPWLGLEKGLLTEPANAAAARDLIAGYHAVRTLSAADRDLLLRLLPLVHVEFALSEVDYFAGLLNDKASADLAWDGYALGHARWFLSSAGQEFLRDVANEGGAA
jgi:Ser/Thr protein kinase RdoA (MazF antagonist)